MMTVWRKIGTLPVKRQWSFSTFIFGEFIRLEHNSDNDTCVLAFFDFPAKRTLIYPRRIYATGVNQVIEIPRFPFSQACVAVQNSIDILGWNISVFVGKLDDGESGYPDGSNFSNAGNGSNDGELLIPGNTVI